MCGNHHSCFLRKALPMMSPQARIILLLILSPLALTINSCSSTLTLDDYNAIFAKQSHSLGRISSGQSLLIYPNGASCDVSITPADKFPVTETLLLPLTEQELGKHISEVQIRTIAISTSDPPSLGLQVTLPNKSIRWLVLRGSGPFNCLVQFDQEFKSRLALVGKFYKFTPWRRECTHLVAVGKGAASILVESQNIGALQIDAVELGDANGAFRADDAMIPWIRFLDGKLKVRADVLDTCFAPRDEHQKQSPEDITRFLRVPKGYCSSNDDHGAQHLECRSSLGVWEGLIDKRGVNLTLVRRTIGAVHFRDQRPVIGTRYARSIVAILTDKPSSAQVAALYETIFKAIKTVTEKSDGSVRMLPGNIKGATHRLFISVENLNIGEVKRREETATSRFIARYEERTNPAKEETRQAMERAEREYRDAKERYDSAKESAQRTYDECVEAAKKTKSLNHKSGIAGLLLDAAIDVGGSVGCAALTDPSEDELNMARQQRLETRATYDSTPSTIQVPIEEDWKYTKYIASRTAEGSVKITMTPVDGEPATTAIPLSYTWQDNEVANDPTHNVEGHPMNKEPINSPDALIPMIARELALKAQTQINNYLTAANFDAAKAEFARSGAGEVMAGYENVDIAAYDVAGPRLIKPLQRGRSKVTAASSTSISTVDIKVASGHCLLAVAAADDNKPLKLTLATTDKRTADQRGQIPAVIELCPESQQKAQDLMVSSDSNGAIRWGLYLTNATINSPKNALTPAPKPNITE
ncbi:MAG: hypothetical protein JW841_06700 [Deltaproteobacteria bacterium]|nr:hypothetical protein [Deltaproteobacteria bacterium]